MMRWVNSLVLPVFAVTIARAQSDRLFDVIVRRASVGDRSELRQHFAHGLWRTDVIALRVVDAALP
jgi:hypothetical protein